MRVALMLAMAGVVMLGGCQKVTQKNFHKVQDGMTYVQVKDILGEGQQTSGVGLNLPGLEANATVYEWRNKDTGEWILIGFVNDKVKYKQYTGPSDEKKQRMMSS